MAVVLFYSLPFFINPRNETLTFVRYLGYCGSITANLLVFYVNFFVFIKRFMLQKRWIVFFVSNLLLISTVSILLYLWHGYYFTNLAGIPMEHIPPPRNSFVFISRDMFFMMLTASMAVAIRVTLEWQHTDREKAKMEIVASQAEIKNLKNQLNPHFLFNTLNNIYSLMRMDQEKAQEAVLSLSKTLRYVLYDNNQEKVSLDKDLAFTKSYIDLMSLRLTDKVNVRVNISEKTEGLTIAPLMFITQVENAFKHGISQAAPSFIDIDIDIHEKVILCSVRNSFFPKDVNDYSGSGIGIDNLQRRLSLIYPGKHSFNYSTLNNVYISELKITL
ncbi:MAG: histidine kinase [Bacteroidales bacterium]